MLWHGSDSLENYLRNKPDGYTEQSIEYRFNSNGFRTEEFDLHSPLPSILCLGCSFTMGTGLPVNQTWPYLLSEYFTNYKVYNLGVAGSSGDTIARILFQMQNKLKTKLVCVLWPEIFRYETYKENRVFHTSAIGGLKIDPKLVIDDIHFENLRYKNKAIMYLLEKQHGYKIIEFTMKDVVAVPNHYARDEHPGPLTQKNIYTMFKDAIENPANVQSKI
jgi:hypothetical protein